MTPFNYLIISSICLSVFYITYLAVFRNSTHFKQMRYFLIFSMLIACILPFNRIQFDNDYITKNLIPKFSEVIGSRDIQFNNLLIKNNKVNQSNNIIPSESNKSHQVVKHAIIHWGKVLTYFYIGIVILLLFRIIVTILFTVKLFFNSSKIKDGIFEIINLKEQNTHFTLFRWIFINKEICIPDSYNQILEHEKIHARQYHSFDVLLIELLSAVMWFNPFVWMLRKSLKLVHEFLADEGVLSTGVNKYQCQELLINQVAESSLVGFSSSFNSSTIKKRMKIMNANREKKTRQSLWLLIPIGILLSLSISVLNSQNSVIQTNNAENKPSAGAIDPAQSDSNKIDIFFQREMKRKINKKTETLYVGQAHWATFDDGMKMALKKNWSLYIAFYSEVKSENEIQMSSTDYTLSIAESERMTKILNSKFEKTNSLEADTLAWAKFYMPKDTKLPVVLKIGYNQKRLPFKWATNPFIRNFSKSLDEYYKSYK